MARPKKKERKIPKREAIVIQAAKDGVAPGRRVSAMDVGSGSHETRFSF